MPAMGQSQHKPRGNLSPCRRRMGRSPFQDYRKAADRSRRPYQIRDWTMLNIGFQVQAEVKEVLIISFSDSILCCDLAAGIHLQNQVLHFATDIPMEASLTHLIPTSKRPLGRVGQSSNSQLRSSHTWEAWCKHVRRSGRTLGILLCAMHRCSPKGKSCRRCPRTRPRFHCRMTSAPAAILPWRKDFAGYRWVKG